MPGWHVGLATRPYVHVSMLGNEVYVCSRASLPVLFRRPLKTFLPICFKEITMTTKKNPRDKQTPHTGKVQNDTNKLGEQEVTQLNQGKRTPDSRSDREAHVGGGNQSQSRRGSVGSPKR